MKEKSKLQEKSSFSYPELEALDRETLEKENLEMRFLLQTHGIEFQGNKLSDTEIICLKQLNILKGISLERQLDKAEVLAVDIFHKNLLVSKNIPVSKVKKKERKTTEELLRSVSEAE